jgi:aminomethyltransferase
MANWRTPLFSAHRALNARIVPFAGWEMPVQYRGIIEEHIAVRTSVGIFDVSHMGRLRLKGPDALGLLEWVCTNQIATMSEGQIRYSLLCHERGGVLDDVLVYRWPDSWGMVVNAANREKILGWLHRHRGDRNVQIADETFDTGMIAVQGPKSLTLCQPLTETDPHHLKYYFGTTTRCLGIETFLSRTGYTGEDGVELIAAKDRIEAIWQELLGRGATPCGLGARDTLRLEAAMPLYGHELSEEIDPFQAGLSWAVKLNKGEFVGRAALSAAQTESKPQRVGLELEGKRAAREQSGIYHDGRLVGRVSSGSFSPTLQRPIALGYVEPSLASPGTQLQIDIRGDRLPARVVKLPFYQRSKN